MSDTPRDPVHQRYLDALARRAAEAPAAVRERLLARQAQAAQAWGGNGAATAGRDVQRPSCTAPAGGAQALAALRARLAQSMPDDGPATLLPPPAGGNAADAGTPAPRPQALKALQQFRADWAQQRTAHQLSRALAQVPAHAGPLNAHGLIGRALQRLQGLSPAYLQHLLAQVEALAWVEQAVGLGEGLARPAAKPGGRAQGTRGARGARGSQAR